MARKKKKSSAKRVLLTLLCIILALILTVMVGATVWVNTFLNQINRVEEQEATLSDDEIESILQETDEPDPEFTGQVLDPEEVTMPGSAQLIETEDHVFNILLIGQDRREGQGRQRSDSMILCTVNLDKKTLVMTSFLRDLYVDIPDWNGKSYSDNRLNVNYVFGGMGMLDKCLEMNFGVVVDHNIEVDFFGFEDIVDMLGGVDIELTSAEAKRVGGGATKGMNHLNGEQALNYARIRKLDSDFGRTNRQRTVLMAMLEKIRYMSLTDLNDLASGILPLITTDMENTEILGYIAKVFPILPELKVSTQHIPAEGTYYGASIRGMSVLVADMEENRRILQESLGG